MKEQRLDEEQADVFVSAWALIRGVQTPHLINMGLRSEEAAAVGDAEFWVRLENCHVVQDHCKSFSRFNFLCSSCVPAAAVAAGILRADSVHIHTWQPEQQNSWIPDSSPSLNILTLPFICIIKHKLPMSFKPESNLSRLSKQGGVGMKYEGMIGTQRA